MTIDEAITHAREVAEGCPAEDRQCAYQHDELADWLEELKAYKATGLTPEEITKYMHLEKEERLVVMSCKAGDKVYVLGEHRIIECNIVEIYLDEKNAIEYLVLFDCGYDCDGCPFNDWIQDPDSGDFSCSGEYGESFIKDSDLGKNVFLTRAAAEAARAVRKGEPNEADSV